MKLLALGEEYPEGTELTPLRGANFELFSTERSNLKWLRFTFSISSQESFNF